MIRRAGGRVGAGFLMLAATLAFGVLAPQPAATQSGAMQRILYGEVLSAEPVVIQDRPSGRGAATGSTVGAIAGAAIAKRGTELIIGLDNGEEFAIQVPGEQQYVPGDRVRLVISPSGATEVRRVRG